MIKLKCSNDQCQYCYEVTEKELTENTQHHRTCLMCGSKLIVANLDEIVAQDIDKRADDYLNQWAREMGWDNVIDLIKRSPNNGVRDLYMKKLREKGLIK